MRALLLTGIALLSARAMAEAPVRQAGHVAREALRPSVHEASSERLQGRLERGQQTMAAVLAELRGATEQLSARSVSPAAGGCRTVLEKLKASVRSAQEA